MKDSLIKLIEKKTKNPYTDDQLADATIRRDAVTILETN